MAVTSNREGQTDRQMMERALELAARGQGKTSPNPMVGAVLVQGTNQIIGEGWHQKAGEPHAEILAMKDARNRGHSLGGSTLYVTLEPCSTQGRTGPCVKAILEAGIARVVCATSDPNPAHQGRGLEFLRQGGVEVQSGILEEVSRNLNRAFNYWIVNRTPLVTLKSAMSLDGKIATASGESRWITGTEARAHAMQFRSQVDAIITGVNTVIADNCSLTVRSLCGFNITHKDEDQSRLRRIVLDTEGRTPLNSNIVSDAWKHLTTVVVGNDAPAERVEALSRQVQVWRVASEGQGRLKLAAVLKKLGEESVTHLLIEAGGTLSESFLHQKLVHRIHFYYAPKIIGGKGAPSGVGGEGVKHLAEAVKAVGPEWKRLGDDFLLEADVCYPER